MQRRADRGPSNRGRSLVTIAALLLLAACAPAPLADVSRSVPAAALGNVALPAMKRFAGSPIPTPGRANAEIAQDILDLEFRMESGRAVPRLTRFEGPITIALAGDVPQTAPADLADLVARLRAEAGLDVRAVGRAQGAAIVVEFLPRARMQAVVPSAACFVVPRVGSFKAYRAQRNSGLVDWTLLRARTNVAIFIPSDTSPQEVRDCLHEEVAQAIGPLNDLYRLPDSVFNDDNFHTVLTGFDMLVLRVHQSPELDGGMTQTEVAARLPALLARLNPQGASGAAPVMGGGGADPSPRAWIDAVETAFGPNATDARRRLAANRALQIAEGEGWRDTRLAFSHFAVGRLHVGTNTPRAVTAFTEAARLYRTLPGGAVHAAHVDMQMAAYALSSGRGAEAVAFADRAIPVVSGAQNAALLATLLLIKAEALDLMGQKSAAQAVRLDSLGWARYGFGGQAEVRLRVAEIAALAPKGPGG